MLLRGFLSTERLAGARKKKRVLSNIFTVGVVRVITVQRSHQLKFCATQHVVQQSLTFTVFRIFELVFHFSNCRVYTLGPIIRRQVVLLCGCFHVRHKSFFF